MREGRVGIRDFDDGNWVGIWDGLWTGTWKDIWHTGTGKNLGITYIIYIILASFYCILYDSKVSGGLKFYYIVYCLGVDP